MSQKFKTVLTNAGVQKLAAGLPPDGNKVIFTEMAVGDGGGALPEPKPEQTALVREVYRELINTITPHPKYANCVVAEMIIPPNRGGFWMRELGLYDSEGLLIAVANMAESYKPLLEEGSGRASTVRMVIAVSNLASVELQIDSSTVTATKDYVDDALDKHAKSRNHPDATLKEKGFVQLSGATDSDSEELAATPKAVKVAVDAAAAADKNADSRLLTINNLEDVPDKTKARRALGLKSAALLDAQTSRDDVTPGKAMLTGNAIAVRSTRAAGENATADVLDANDLPTNAVSFTYSSAKNAPGFSASVLGYSGLSGGYDVQLAASYDTPGLVRLRTQNGDVKKWSKWTTFYTTENKPTSADVGAVSAAGGSVGYLENSDHYGTKDGAWPGAGGFWAQIADRRALFYSAGYTAEGNVFLPMTKATVQTKNLGYMASISYGALVSGGANFPSACLHILCDQGNSTYKDSTWIFNPNDGKFSSPGDVVSGNNTVATGGVFESGGAVRVYSPNNPPPLDLSWVAGTSWVFQSFVSDVTLGAQGFHGPAANNISWTFGAPPGCVFTGIAVQDTGSNSADNIGGVYYKPILVSRGGAWVQIGG
ncbi:phage tail protein [Cedecea davisae]|uniref:phage tail protein n=1 Tax=Cedecea davisae TaxID=158484 RepID=UPI00376F1BBD